MQRFNGRRICISYVYSFQSYNLFNGINHMLLYSTSISSSTTDSFANYLINSLGFSPQKALTTSSKLAHYRKVNEFSFDSNANSVVGFFRNYGFDDTHVKKIVSLYPRILCSNVDNTIVPKLQFLQTQGFSGSDLIQLISANPNLLVSGADSSIGPTVEVLRKVMGYNSFVVAVMKKIQCRAFSSVTKNLLSNVALLNDYGIPIEVIRKWMFNIPMCCVRKPKLFKDVVMKVEKKLGIRRDSSMFMYGIKLLCGHNEETIESKCRTFKSFGWTQNDIEMFMMKNTNCFTISDATIKKKLDYLMNEVGLEPAFLISRNYFFTCSLEKRVMPRHKVLLILKEKGLMKKVPALGTAIQLSESRFLDMFVIPFKEVHEVYGRHTGCKMLTQRSM